MMMMIHSFCLVTFLPTTTLIGAFVVIPTTRSGQLERHGSDGSLSSRHESIARMIPNNDKNNNNVADTSLLSSLFVIPTRRRQRKLSTIIATTRTTTPTVLYATSDSSYWRPKSDLALGIQSLQMLISDKRRDQLCHVITKQYPILPQSAVDSCIDMVASAIGTLSPKVLQEALEPGGMDNVIPQIRQTVIDFALQQEVVQNFPGLSTRNKTKILGAVVDFILDRLLEDAEWVLMSPQNRLRVLFSEIQMIQTYEMTKLQVIWFSLCRKPIVWLSLMIGGMMTIYAQICHSGSFPQALVATWKAIQFAGLFLLQLIQKQITSIFS